MWIVYTFCVGIISVRGLQCIAAPNVRSAFSIYFILFRLPLTDRAEKQWDSAGIREAL